mmetsp:Transcript_7106/g.20633  ORF Transcript_7106/g.20633 Transcript_7106/m.20633 type:complete len:132 (+) Transcript_7106:2450-2845(+)
MFDGSSTSPEIAQTKTIAERIQKRHYSSLGGSGSSSMNNMNSDHTQEQSNQSILLLLPHMQKVCFRERIRFSRSYTATQKQLIGFHLLLETKKVRSFLAKSKKYFVLLRVQYPSDIIGKIDYYYDLDTVRY